MQGQRTIKPLRRGGTPIVGYALPEGSSWNVIVFRRKLAGLAGADLHRVLTDVNVTEACDRQASDPRDGVSQMAQIDCFLAVA